MAKITSLKAGKKQQNRVNLFLNGKFTVSLEAGVTVDEGLQVGQEMSAGHLEEIKTADRIQRCLGAATQFLGYRQRSEAELRDRLQRRGFESDSIDAVINKLKKHGLVDDVAFAGTYHQALTAELEKHIRTINFDVMDVKHLLNMKDLPKYDFVTLLNALHEVKVTELSEVILLMSKLCKEEGLILVVDMEKLPHLEWEAITWNKMDIKEIFSPVVNKPDDVNVAATLLPAVAVSQRSVPVYHMRLFGRDLKTKNMGSKKAIEGVTKDIKHAIIKCLYRKRNEVSSVLEDYTSKRATKSIGKPSVEELLKLYALYRACNEGILKIERVIRVEPKADKV